MTTSHEENVTGSFLQGRQNTLQCLLETAKNSPPKFAKALLREHVITGDGIASAMKANDALSEGYWLVSLGAIIFEHEHGRGLPAAPREVQENLDMIAKVAKKTNPKLFQRSDFLSSCSELMQYFEKEMKSEQIQSEQNERDFVSPIDVAKSGYTASVRIRSAGDGMAFPYSHFSLVEDSGEKILVGEFSAEDLTFIAASALRASKDSISSALSVVREDRLGRESEESMMTERLQGIVEDAHEIERLLGQIRASTQPID